MSELERDGEREKTGQAKESRKRQDQCVDVHQRERLEASGSKSETDGDVSLRAGGSSSQGGIERSIETDRTAALGGILSQLRILREAHLAYAKAHGERLEARLQENRAYVERVNQELDNLEEQLVQLLSVNESDEELDEVGLDGDAEED